VQRPQRHATGTIPTTPTPNASEPATAPSAIPRRQDHACLEDEEEPWACALCGDKDRESPSQEHPAWCDECASFECPRCGTAEPGGESRDYAGVCGWCADQWDDDP
jgi:hypothetical protein